MSYNFLIIFSNYDNNKKTTSTFVANNNNDSWQHVKKVICENKNIQEYILSFGDEWNLHISINNNNFGNEFFSKSVKELKTLFGS